MNPNLRITYPTFGLIVETRNELKIQVFGSFSREMTYLIERCRGYFDKYFHFEPTKPLELNESDGLWTVSVQSSFGQISLPQDSLKKVLIRVDVTLQFYH